MTRERGIRDEATSGNGAWHKRVDSYLKATERLRQLPHQHRHRSFRRRIMRQIARCAGVQRCEEQERTGLPRRNQFPGKFAGEVKARIDIDCPHLLPGMPINGERMVRFTPWWRSAVNEMRHMADP